MKRWQIILIIVFAVLVTVRLLTRDNFHEVTPNEIYRSAQLSAGKLKDVVNEYGIKTVINLRRPRPEKDWYSEEIAMAASLGVEHHDIGMDLTFSPRVDQLFELRDLIENAPKPLLVHCRAGADRTGLAAVMVKLLDGSSSLQEARAQVSWKYHAVRDNSIGIPFFNSYSGWLDANDRSHSKHNFNYWLENEYVDISGNVHFLVSPIAGQTWWRPWGDIQEGFEFMVDRAGSETLDLSGWAFDTRNISVLESVEVFLGGVRFEESEYGLMQDWLINDFGKHEYLASGWTASHPMQQFEDGCHDLVLKFDRLDGDSWISPPTARICIQ